MSTTYFVIPDDYSSHHTDENTFSLQHYLNNTSKYFVSHNQLHFMESKYYLNSDLIIKDINNFTITGPTIGQCSIICTSLASIVVMNINNINFQNINLINCIKDHKDFFHVRAYNFNIHCLKDYRPYRKVINTYASLLLYNSSSVIIYNMNINVTVNTSFTGILVMNVKDKSKMINVKVQVNIFNCPTFSNHPTEINGLRIVVHFYDRISEYGLLTIDNFYYNNNKTCENHLFHIIATMFLRNCRDYTMNTFRLEILNSVFSDLKNSTVLHICGETRGEALKKSTRYITIRNSTFSDNSGTGNSNLNMFNIEIENYNVDFSLSRMRPTSMIMLIYYIIFINCTFTRNSNMEALMYVRLPNTEMTTEHISFSNSIFSDNQNVTFIKVQLEFQNIFYKIIYITLVSVNVSSNKHHYTGNLILIMNGILYFHSVVFNQNRDFDNIVYLQSSTLYIVNHNDVSSNHARYIIKAQSNSFLYIHYMATANISYNTVYKIIKQVTRCC